jgi:hypothetical protein
MVERMFKKGLVVGIIILLIGVGIQPVIAIQLEEEIEPIRDSPVIEFMTEKLGDKWVAIWVMAYDQTSGLNRLEIYFDGELKKIFYGAMIHEKILQFTYPPVPYTIIKAVAYDNAGNRAEKSINLKEMFDFNFHPVDKSSNQEIYNEEDCDFQELDGPGWKFFLFGHITNIEIFEFENWTLMNATALYIRGIVLNLFRNYPNIPFPIRWIGGRFCIPYEWVKIMFPTLTGNHFIIAFGTTDI